MYADNRFPTEISDYIIQQPTFFSAKSLNFASSLTE